MSGTERGYRDLHEHIAALDKAGLLITVDEPVDKDAEMHSLVRWQFVGGLKESERKAFLFRNVVNGKGRKYDLPIVVGALAANQDIYSVGMGVPVAEIGARWDHAIAHPIPPVIVTDAACHEVVIEGADLLGEGKGIDSLPIPVSTPGFDNAPTLTSTNVVTRDPDTGIQNMGTYRAALKASDRMVIRMATRVGGAGGYQHYKKHRARGDKEMPVAIVLGCPPCVAFMGPQKLPIDMDEIGVAGGLMGAPINMVKARMSDLMIPAEAELVIEGIIDTEMLEPEGPFGESHGHVNLEEYNFVFEVSAITHRGDAVFTSM
ncbi:MAG: UbiD family decarboxylase, partial [Proteobacteria bacterium]|nr:UbiD family decarboxylase [Pseudomonadota bacterium]